MEVLNSHSAEGFLTSGRSQSWYLDPLVARQKGATFLGWILGSLPSTPVERVLKTDVFEEANGDDRLLDALLPHAWLKVGIDINADAVQRASANGGSFACVCTDVRQLPFRLDTFDVVVSTSTLDHFETRGEIVIALQELVQVLRPGGTILVILDNPYNPLYWPLKFLTRLGFAPFQLGHTMSPGDLVAHLRSAGLAIHGQDYLIHNPRLISTAIFTILRRSLGARADAPIRALLAAFAILDRFPTRCITACFCAVSARKPEA